ncbi:MAG: aryl-sulfate sulfotransferase [Nonlabens sp.]
MSCIITLYSCSENDLNKEDVVLNDTVSIYERGISEGYTLISPLGSSDTFLINNEGFEIHRWESESIALMSYLNRQGDLIRVLLEGNSSFSGGGATGAIEILNFESERTWYWQYNSDNYVLHHDIELLPNGNILALVWEKKTESEAIESGRNPALLFENEVHPCKIIEIQPMANNAAGIVWEWSAWDHLIQDHDVNKNNFGDVAAHPELIDINFTSGEANFNHLNSIDFIEELNQIVVTSRLFNEFWIIDHSTTTTQASTNSGGNSNKGGDLLYRWGNPVSYNAGNIEDQQLYGPHDATWIGDTENNGGNFLVFNNNKFDDKSSVDEIAIPLNQDGTYDLMANTSNLPASTIWNYDSEIIYSSRLSGAQRLDNGNTLITVGREGKLVEIDNSGSVIWQYQNPTDGNKSIFKVVKYGESHPAFEGRVFSNLTKDL